MVFKLKMLSDIEEESYVDCWIKADQIQGFLIPTFEDGNPDPSNVNLLISGEIQTFQSEDHLATWLLQTFVNTAITNQ
jgi:hypothetical protein